MLCKLMDFCTVEMVFVFFSSFYSNSYDFKCKEKFRAILHLNIEIEYNGFSKNCTIQKRKRIFRKSRYWSLESVTPTSLFFLSSFFQPHFFRKKSAQYAARPNGPPLYPAHAGVQSAVRSIIIRDARPSPMGVITVKAD